MYRNYGDVNFFEHGRLVDSDHSDSMIDVIYCEPYPDEEDLYQFAEVTVDVTDDWIDKKAVCCYAGLTDPDPAEFAEACVDYYGPEEFGADSCPAYDWRQMTKDDIMDILKWRMIAADEVELD